MKLALSLALTMLLLTVAVFSATPAVYSAQATATPPEAGAGYQEIADRFFDVLAEEGGETAILYGFSHSPYAAQIEEQLDSVIEQYTDVESVMDAYVGRELLLETNVADRLLVQHYMVLYERQPIQMQLTFFKPRDEWVFQNFSFDTDLVTELSELTSQSLADSEKVSIQAP